MTHPTHTILPGLRTALTISTSFLRFYAPLGLSEKQAMLVLVIMAYVPTDESGFPSPTYAELSAQTRVPVTTLRRWISDLRDKGYVVTKQTNVAGTHGGGPNTFDFTPLFAAVVAAEAAERAA